MKKFLLLACILGCIFTFVSCDSSGNGMIEYIPFRSSSDSKWGMISMDGKVLFEEEFKDCPTLVTNGMFMVQNGNGMWELYKASAKPERVGDDYLGICNFTDDVTPAVKKNEKITLIDKNGTVKATLDKAKGKNISACSGFVDGLAMIETEDGKRGLINTSGKVVVDPKFESIIYENGLFFGITYESEKNYRVFTVLNSNGETIQTLKVGDGQKYSNIDPYHSSPKYLAVSTKSDGEEQWGIIDYKKETILKPSTKIKSIGEFKDDMFIFFNEEYNGGLMKINGDVVIRAKYDQLKFISDDLLAYSDNGEWYIINLDGDKITKDSYKEVFNFVDGKHAFVKIDDNGYGIIDKKGNELKDIKLDIHEIGTDTANEMVYSDFVDFDAIIADAMIKKEGIMGFTLQMTPLQIIQNYNKIKQDDQEAIPESPDEVYYRSRVLFTKQYKELEMMVDVIYDHSMTVNNASYDEYGYYQNDDYNWSSESPKYIQLKLSGDKVGSNSKLLFSKITSVVKNFGKVSKQNENSITVEVSDNLGWLVSKEGDSIEVTISNDIHHCLEY